MKSKHAVICLLIFTLSVISNKIFAQVLTLIDSETKKPVEGATIIGSKTNVILSTNSLGESDISILKNLENIRISHIGYIILTLSYEQIIEKAFRIEMQPSYPQLSELVVSSTKWNQPSWGVPSKISVIKSKDLTLINPQTTADLLGTSGEVFIQKSQQGGGSPMIRGYSANRLLYVVDGVRMNSAIFRSGNIQNIISLDAFSLENTEVLFGPGSVIYGSDAIGGVMNFQTLVPYLSINKKTESKINFVSRFSSANNEITNHLDLRLGFKKWATVTSITFSKFGDLKMGEYGPEEYLRTFIVRQNNGTDLKSLVNSPGIQIPTAYNQINLMQKFKFKPSKSWELEYGVHYSETSSYGRYDRLIETKEDKITPVFAQWNYGPQIWSLNQLSINHDKKWLFYNRFSLKASHQYFEESRTDRGFLSKIQNTNLEKVNAYSLNLDFEKKLNSQNINYGYEWVKNKVNSQGSGIDISNNKPINIPDRYPNSDWISSSIYLNYQRNLFQNLVMQVGGRFANYTIDSDFSRHLSFYKFDFTESKISNSALTGSLGWVYNPKKQTKIFLNGSTGFRAPNVDDIGKIFDFSFKEVVLPNTSLKAEYIWNTEFGFNQIVSNKLIFDFTVFYSYLDKAMVRRPFKVGGQDSILYNGVLSKAYAIKNAAYATVFGFNAGFEYALTKNLIISSRYNFQKGKEEMENGEISASRHAAPTFGQTSIIYNYNGLKFQISTIYNAEVSNKNLNLEEQNKIAIYAKDSEGKPYSPSWITLNCKTLFQLNKTWSFSLGLENITNVRYRPYSSGLVAPGRNFVISINLRP